ncbi:MAG: hypothetical protein QOF83_580, partial [Solirubrobacteraceae bacterium]|nr:hypothetical protein [Solirubrobacteraceae bacterium]
MQSCRGTLATGRLRLWLVEANYAASG